MGSENDPRKDEARSSAPELGTPRKSRLGRGDEPAGSTPDVQSQSSSLDATLAVLDRINQAVSKYDLALRQRAIDVLMEQAFGPKSAGESRGVSHPIGGEKNPIPRGAEFVSLVERWTPDTQPQWALLAAYFETHVKGKETTTGQDVNSTLKDHGTTVRNITDALGANMAARPAFIMQVAKSGSSRQARKTYKVTTQGAQFVEARLSGTVDEGRDS
ncbi:MAG TPA: hypothetical protein VGV89_07045 [Thermoplasmata archaeon]|nr:hypothetical protein [Thermoplasmata archaeon]